MSDQDLTTLEEWVKLAKRQCEFSSTYSTVSFGVDLEPEGTLKHQQQEVFELIEQLEVAVRNQAIDQVFASVLEFMLPLKTELRELYKALDDFDTSCHKSLKHASTMEEIQTHQKRSLQAMATLKRAYDILLASRDTN